MPKDTEYTPTNERTPGASQSQSGSQPPQHSLKSFWNSERAQTSIDLLLAVTIFFSAVALLTITSPQLFFPQSISATDTTTEADRIVIELTDDTLTEPGVSGLTNEGVTDFFESDDDLHEKFGLENEPQVHMNLTTTARNDPPLALDADEEFNYDIDDTGSVLFVTRGEDPDGASSSYTRSTSLNNKPVTITVTVERQ